MTTRVSGGPDPAHARADFVDEPLLAGTEVAERYRVLAMLGRGGMGVVYLASNVRAGGDVAIKVLYQAWSTRPDVAMRFRNEALFANQADHPNIVKVLDFGTLPDGRLYLVMEFINGNTLLDEIREHGPMEVGRACRIARDVARAVNAAHQRGVIHRDLKPENVMLARYEGDDAEFVKVVDFGISALAHETGRSRVTRPGESMGTPEYMAPEQATGKPPTFGIDVYAMGVLLFEMLTGRPPFVGGSAVELLTRKNLEAAPSLATLRPDADPHVVALVDASLDMDPEHRPHHAGELLRELDIVLGGLIVTLPASVVDERPRVPTPLPQRDVALTPEVIAVDSANGVADPWRGSAGAESARRTTGDGAFESGAKAAQSSPGRGGLSPSSSSAGVSSAGVSSTGASLEVTSATLPTRDLGPIPGVSSRRASAVDGHSSDDAAAAGADAVGMSVAASRTRSRGWWAVGGALALGAFIALGLRDRDDAVPAAGSLRDREGAGASLPMERSTSPAARVVAASASPAATEGASPPSAPARVDPKGPATDPVETRVGSTDGREIERPSAPREKTLPPQKAPARRQDDSPARVVNAGGASDLAPAATTARCRQLRAEASDHRTRGNWRSLLVHTQATECWTDRSERLRLRVEALFELGRFSECVAEGDGLRDARIVTVVASCRKRIPH